LVAFFRQPHKEAQYLIAGTCRKESFTPNHSKEGTFMAFSYILLV
jgi:hypothetical protein